LYELILFVQRTATPDWRNVKHTHLGRSGLSVSRLVLGAGAGGLWDRITDMGVPRLSPGDAVEAFEEAITLIRMLSGGGPPVTYRGRHHEINKIEPAPVAAPPVWTGSVGPKSLAATGRVADGST
jgi:alkanesulfonate monooxygenase SsuD/methylene tetrahydromethanopterin reductase-like flavin-dependent oxidoreductase (luciferase family)